MEEVKGNKRDSGGHSGGKAGKWKADSAFLEKRIVDNSRSYGNSRSVFTNNNR